MAIKFAHALGAHVVVFTTSPNKKEDAFRLGADDVVISRDKDQMRKHRGSFDFILDAVSAEHDINAYIQLLRRDGNITIVGAPDKPHAISAFNLLLKRRRLDNVIDQSYFECTSSIDVVAGKNHPFSAAQTNVLG